MKPARLILPLLPLAALAATPAADKPGHGADFVTTREMQRETMATVWSLENQHMLRRRVTEFNMEDLVRDFCAKLDPARMVFLETDVAAATRRHAVMMDVWLENGNLSAPFAIYKDFMARLDERIVWINARLDRPFDFTAKETFGTDRAKAPWPASGTDADALWEKRLKADLLVELLGAAEPDSPDTDEAAESAAIKPPPATISPERLEAARAKLKKRYARMRHFLGLDAGEVEEIFLNTLAQRYDPHTAFFSKQTQEEFNIMMRNSLCGIGAVLADEDGYCTVKELLPGGPVESSGLVKVGDRIVAFAEGSAEPEDIVGLRLNKAVAKLRGKKGTAVTLVIEPAADRSARKKITLVRDEVKLTTQLASARIIEVPGPAGAPMPLGVIELPSFYGKTDAEGEAFSASENVEELIGKLKKHGVRGLVLDLRANGGGLVEEAVNLVGLFIPTGPVLQVKDADGSMRQLRDQNDKVAWSGPLVVLVSKMSASASEIFAGAMQDYRRAVIVGDPQTHGKGSVQGVIQYNRLDSRLRAAAKVTMQKWYLPAGNSIQLKGVAADIPVASPYSVFPNAESDLERPLPWDAIGSSINPDAIAADATTVHVTPDLLKSLREASALRRTEFPEFLPFDRSVAWTGERVTKKDISLNFDERRRTRLDDIAFRDKLKSDFVQLSAQNGYKSTEVKLDAALALARKESGAKPGAKSPKSIRTLKAGAAAPDADDTWPDFDVQLRESLRILGDWTRSTPPPAAKVAANG